MHYDVKFYADVGRHHETQPCRNLGHSYATLEAAESAAVDLVTEIQEKFGKDAGYAVIDDAGRVLAIGPRRNIHA